MRNRVKTFSFAILIIVAWVACKKPAPIATATGTPKPPPSMGLRASIVPVGRLEQLDTVPGMRGLPTTITLMTETFSVRCNGSEHIDLAMINTIPINASSGPAYVVCVGTENILVRQLT